MTCQSHLDVSLQSSIRIIIRRTHEYFYIGAKYEPIYNLITQKYSTITDARFCSKLDTIDKLRVGPDKLMGHEEGYRENSYEYIIKSNK